VLIRIPEGIDKRFGWNTAAWDLDYLVAAVGQTVVMVETPKYPKDPAAVHGIEPEMLNLTFKEYVEELKQPTSDTSRSLQGFPPFYQTRYPFVSEPVDLCEASVRGSERGDCEASVRGSEGGVCAHSRALRAVMRTLHQLITPTSDTRGCGCGFR
jgi:hypothetical protein